MQSAVGVKDLVVQRGDVRAVNGLSFSIDQGEVLALLGPNGAGKSSTVETLEGYLAPHSGSVSVLGLDPRRDHASLVRHIGVMLQRGGIYPSLGPAQALELFASYYDKPLDPKGLIERLGLGDVAKTPWRRLSGGEQQRTSLALALIGQPRVLFLDEPTAGVDIHGRLAIRDVIAEQAAKGVAVLLTTHELSEAEVVADRIAIMVEGCLARIGAQDDLLAPGLRFVSSSGLDVSVLSSLLGVDVVEESSGRYRVSADSNHELVGRLSTWLVDNRAPLNELHPGGSLEELYLSLVGVDAAHVETHVTAPARRRRR